MLSRWGIEKSLSKSKIMLDIDAKGNYAISMDQPIQVMRTVRGKQHAYARKPWTQTVWRERPCSRCTVMIQPQSSRTRYCDICKLVVEKTKEEVSRHRRYNNKYGLLLDCIICPSCELPFKPHQRKQTHCNQQDQCRPWVARFKENGSQAPCFRIGTLTTAEYAFYRIMQDKGTQLDFLKQGVSGLFQLRRGCYTPDFYDPNSSIYYEVVGSRQRLALLKPKFTEAVLRYSDVCFKLVYPNGTEITLNAR